MALGHDSFVYDKCLGLFVLFLLTEKAVRSSKFTWDPVWTTGADVNLFAVQDDGKTLRKATQNGYMTTKRTEQTVPTDQITVCSIQAVHYRPDPHAGRTYGPDMDPTNTENDSGVYDSNMHIGFALVRASCFALVKLTLHQASHTMNWLNSSACVRTTQRSFAEGDIITLYFDPSSRSAWIFNRTAGMMIVKPTPMAAGDVYIAAAARAEGALMRFVPTAPVDFLPDRKTPKMARPTKGK
jgi:hypothetical protein